MKPVSQRENVDGKAESERLSVSERLMRMRRCPGRAVQLRRALRLQRGVPVRWWLRLREGEVTPGSNAGRRGREGRRAPTAPPFRRFMASITWAPSSVHTSHWEDQ